MFLIQVYVFLIGRAVTVLTDNLIENFTYPSSNNSENVGGVVDDIYYLLTTGNDG